MTTRVRASSKGQVVLPKRTRDRLGIESGTELDVIETPGGVELRPVKGSGITVEEAVRRLRQIIRYDGPRRDEVDWQHGIDKAIRAKWGEHST